MTRNKTAIQAQEVTGIVTSPKPGNDKLAEQRGAALKARTGAENQNNHPSRTMSSRNVIQAQEASDNKAE
eukprot:9874760-Ditylum_brightwellii.AAC.1